MKLNIKAGATSNILQIFINDSSSTTGGGLTGLTSASSGLTAYYHKQSDTTATAIALVTMTVGTFTSSGFKEIDSTNMPGWYQFCPPDAAFSSATAVAFHLKGATNMAPVPIEVELTAYDPQDATRLGLSALPNANAAANGGLPTVDANNAIKVQSGTGANQINLSSGNVGVQAGTGTGQLDFTSGVVKSNLVQILATALTETAGQIAAAFKQFFNIASPTSTMNVITTVSNLTTNNDKAGYTASTVSDKTGYSLTQAFPTNFASLVIDVNGRVDISKLNGTALNNLIAGRVDANVGVNNDKTGYALTQSFPTNFGLLSIDANGKVLLTNPTLYQKNVALNNFMFFMTDSTTHAPKTGLTVTVNVSKDGAAFGASTNSVVEVSNGWYKINFTQTEMNANEIALNITATGADPLPVKLATNS